MRMIGLKVPGHESKFLAFYVFHNDAYQLLGFEGIWCQGLTKLYC